MAGKKGTESNPIFFKSGAEYRAWLEKNHDSAKELWIGYWKKATGKPSLTWQETVDESLCFGWIDGIRKSIDSDSFKQRVTPRRPTSIWSKVNIRHVARLTADGRMHAVGLAVFEKRDRTKAYSYEQDRDQVPLGPAYEAQFRKENPKAWEFFQRQPPYYRRLGGWYVMSARKEETRQQRLERLIRDSAAGRRLGLLAPKKKPEA
jgi:uncharacterized protein YdeI (YjbR/CyaY-like superfamily)